MAAFRENEAREAAGWHEPPVPEQRFGHGRGAAASWPAPWSRALLALVLIGLLAGGAGWRRFGSGPGGRVEAAALPVAGPSTAAPSTAPLTTPAAA